MPKTTVYIRNNDWSKWKLIDNKAELISQAINHSLQPIEKEVVNPGPVITKKNRDLDFCKHDAVKGFCKKGCR